MADQRMETKLSFRYSTTENRGEFDTFKMISIICRSAMVAINPDIRACVTAWGNSADHHGVTSSLFCQVAALQVEAAADEVQRCCGNSRNSDCLVYAEQTQI